MDRVEPQEYDEWSAASFHCAQINDRHDVLLYRCSCHCLFWFQTVVHLRWFSSSGSIFLLSVTPSSTVTSCGPVTTIMCRVAALVCCWLSGGCPDRIQQIHWMFKSGEIRIRISSVGQVCRVGYTCKISCCSQWYNQFQKNIYWRIHRSLEGWHVATSTNSYIVWKVNEGETQRRIILKTNYTLLESQPGNRRGGKSFVIFFLLAYLTAEYLDLKLMCFMGILKICLYIRWYDSA